MKLNKNAYCVIICILVNISCCAEEVIYSPMFNCTVHLDNPYGVCTHVSRKGVKYEFYTKELELQMINQLNAKIIRTDFDWKTITDRKNKRMQFALFDSVMASVESFDLQCLGILSSPWGQDNSDWKEYVLNTVSRYKKITHWEMINEADLKYKRLQNFSYANYADCLKWSYKKIKEQNKNALILFSGLANAKREFLDSILKQGTINCFDIMNIHHYANKKVEPESFLEYFQKLSSKFRKLKIDKSVWLGETGCTTALGWSSEMKQAIRLPRIFLISFACGIDKVFWYNTRSNELHKDDKESHFGLWHKDYKPKPSFYAFQTLIRMCPDKSLRPVLKQLGNIYIAQWEREDGENVYALWTSDEKVAISLRMDGEYKVYDVFGRVLKNKTRYFEISPSVLYFVGCRGFRLFVDS